MPISDSALRASANVWRHANFELQHFSQVTMKRYSSIGRILCSSLFVVITADVAHADNVREAPATAPGCTIFFGGTGTRSGNADFDQRWITINKTVSNATIEKLIGLHYRIEPFFSEAGGAQEAFENLYRAVQQKQCDQVIQLSHELTMPSKPGSVPHLNFKISVFHLERNEGSRSAKVISEYEQGYPFELTKAVLENLSLSTVGETIATDVDAARVLAARGP
jgi:hypothetical protein